VLLDDGLPTSVVGKDKRQVLIWGSWVRTRSIQVAMVIERRAPNVLVTGTPGTGKTTTCEAVAERTGLRHINVSDLVKTQELHQGWDAEHDALVIDEDKVLVPLLKLGSR
jgi:MoxR-like ATPase